MRIKEIELVGFKSFVDKTRFSFGEGISGIVGPNGCGKSNIVDAIRWVMGEMSAKSLRGGEMQDVIFNGSDTRKPMGMAQVSILFSCEDGVSPTGYEGMAEIQVTRRLFRSGESEYLINKRPCRLKDVIDLFLDTGIGSRAYSIIEQGQIARIISAKPQERRVLIEEAAGISKYRVKREEALRKIEATQTNLARVNDVIFEIKRTVGSLQRQAAKAERYHEFKAELKVVDLELAARERALLSKQDEQVRETVARLTDLRQAAVSKLEAEELRLSALRLEVLEHEKAIGDASQKAAALRDALRGDEAQRELLARDIEHLSAQIELWTEEADGARERIDALEQDARQAAEEIARLDEKTRAAEASLTAAQHKLREAQARRQELDATAEAARRELLRLAGRQATLQQAVRNHEENAGTLRSRLDGVNARQAEIDAAIDRTAGDGETLRQRMGQLQEERTRLEAELTDRKARLVALRQAAEGKRQTFAAAKETYEKTRVRLESLEDMRRNLEGYQEGVRRIMEAARAENVALNGSAKDILGVLADKLEVDEDYETALEAALGDRLQSVLVADQEAGAAAADFLKSEKAGRGSFVPVHPKPPTGGFPTHTLEQSLGPLSELVRVSDPEFRSAADALLANVLVVEDLATAVRLHKENGFVGSLVTLDGEVVDCAGTITGGNVDAVASGILQKQREIAALQESATAQQAAFAKAEREHYAHEGLIARSQEVIAQTQKALDDNRIALSEAGGEARRAGAELERLRAEKATLAQQYGGLTKQSAELTQRRAADERELEDMNRALHAARHAADEKTAAQIALAAEIDGCQKNVAEAMLTANSLRQEKRNAEARRDSRLHAKEEAAALVAKRTEQMAQAGETQDQHRARIAEITAGLVGRLAELEAAEREAVRVREGVDEQIAAADQCEAGIKLLRRDLEGYERELHAADLTASQLTLRREHLAEKLREKYQVELAELPPAADEAELDTEALRTRAQEIGAKIAQMGEVNPNAVEEYAQEKERLDHYVAQKDDLETAIDELKKAIAKINKTSKERFTETFELVSHKFSEVMPVLFGGGSAKLLLTEPDDPLESGVDITIRPPGKKLTNVNLLSGGEKALASIGLIFSIFLIKPSPFCLLDEVDAPLDDANIYRFNTLVEQMASHSQVLLITHNKSTMEVADALYGVTMEEKGVSKLVTVKLVDEPAKN